MMVNNWQLFCQCLANKFHLVHKWPTNWLILVDSTRQHGIRQIQRQLKYHTNWDQTNTNTRQIKTSQIQILDKLRRDKYKCQTEWNQINTNTRQTRQIQMPDKLRPDKYKCQTDWDQTSCISLCRSASIVPLSLLLPFLQHLLSPEDRMARLVGFKFEAKPTNWLLSWEHWMPPARDWKVVRACWFCSKPKLDTW